MALYNSTGLVAPRLSLYNVCFHFTRFCVLDVLPVGLVRKLQCQFTPGVKNLHTYKIFKVLLRSGRVSKSRFTSTEAEALATRRPRSGRLKYLFDMVICCWRFITTMVL